MKHIVRFALVMALMVGLFAGFTPAKAALQTYNSGFQVQNLEGTEAAITIHFYARNGTEALNVSDTIAANGSNTYFPLDTTGGLPGDLADNFDGSVVIESTTQVAAITNILGADEGGDILAYGASYSGFSSGSTSAYLPLLMKGNYGFNTWFSVQNLGSAPADVTVTYSDGIVQTATDVAPGAAAKFEQATEAHDPTPWVGSAVVTADQPIAITVLEVGSSTLFAYDSFPAGSLEPAMPLVQENNYNYITGIQIQNVGTATTTVTVDYTPGGAFGTACQETRTIPAGQSVSFALYVFTTFTDPNPASLVSETCTQSEQFVGSGVVTANSNSQNLVAIINQLNSGANKGAAYNGFAPAAGTERVVFPLIMDRNYGYFTGLNVVNVGSGAVAQVTCTISGNDLSGPNTKVFSTTNLAPGAGWNLVNLNGLGDRFVGSASCEGSAGSALVGSVNEVNVGSGKDAFLVYEGTNP